MSKGKTPLRTNQMIRHKRRSADKAGPKRLIARDISRGEDKNENINENLLDK